MHVNMDLEMDPLIQHGRLLSRSASAIGPIAIPK